MRQVYQDIYLETDCPECGGAGFFGNGPYVDPCDYCRGTGVLINESVLLSARKPVRRATASQSDAALAVKTEVRYRGGEQ